MSFRAQAWAIDVEETLAGKGIDKAEKFVLMMLAYCHNEEAGCAWCSQPWLARKTRMTRRAVIRIIRRLQERGIIAIEHRATSSNLYTFPALEFLANEVKEPRQAALPIAKQMAEQLELGAHQGVNAGHGGSEPGSRIPVTAGHVPRDPRSPNLLLLRNNIQRRAPRNEREKRKADLEGVRAIARGDSL